MGENENRRSYIKWMALSNAIALFIWSAGSVYADKLLSASASNIDGFYHPHKYGYIVSFSISGFVYLFTRYLYAWMSEERNKLLQDVGPKTNEKPHVILYFIPAIVVLLGSAIETLIFYGSINNMVLLQWTFALCIPCVISCIIEIYPQKPGHLSAENREKMDPNVLIEYIRSGSDFWKTLIISLSISLIAVIPAWTGSVIKISSIVTSSHQLQLLVASLGITYIAVICIYTLFFVLMAAFRELQVLSGYYLKIRTQPINLHRANRRCGVYSKAKRCGL